MPKVRVAFVLALLIALAGPAWARALAGATFPDQVTVEGKTLALNGLGLRTATFLNVKVYVAGLYLESRGTDAARIIESTQVKQLTLRFLREVKRDQVVEAWTTGFEKNAGKNLSSLKARIDKLDSWMTDFHDRDTLTFTYVPGTGVSIDVNTGRVASRKGTIAGDDFARGLFAIWLGPEPPNAALKDGLLGKR